MLSLEAAKRAGITPDSAGRRARRLAGAGIGHHYVHSWIAPLHSFKIGDEEIRDTKLYIGDIGTSLASSDEMLLGADFFLSHRIYVANSRDKLYFTYNGGPVFNVGVRRPGRAAKRRVDRRGLRPEYRQLRRADRRRGLQPARHRLRCAPELLERHGRPQPRRELAPTDAATAISAGWPCGRTGNRSWRSPTSTRPSSSSRTTCRAAGARPVAR